MSHRCPEKRGAIVSPGLVEATCQNFMQVVRCIAFSTDLCLYKKDSLFPHVSNTVIDVDDSIFFHFRQHGVQYNECPSPTYSCTTMDQEGVGISTRVDLTDSMGEMN